MAGMLAKEVAGEGEAGSGVLGVEAAVVGGALNPNGGVPDTRRGWRASGTVPVDPSGMRVACGA